VSSESQRLCLHVWLANPVNILATINTKPEESNIKANNRKNQIDKTGCTLKLFRASEAISKFGNSTYWKNNSEAT
jgi:hypothetical protein